MASPEQGGNPETPLQRKIRETREFIRRLLGQVDADPQKTDAQKKQEKESMARTSQDELKRKVSDYEKIPESQRDDDKIEEDMLTHVNELAELVKNKVVPHVPEITEAVVIALATKKFDKKKAILIGSIVGEIVDSPEFKSVANRGIDEVRGSLKNLASRLRGEGHGDMADTIDGEVAASEPPKEPPKPPEGPPGGPETPEDAENDRGEPDIEPIEKYLEKYYIKRKQRKDPSGKPLRDENGNYIYEDVAEGWLEIAEEHRTGYYGVSSELQKSLLGAALQRQIQLSRRQMVILRAFDGPEEFKAYFRAMRDMQADLAGKQIEQIDVNKVYKEMSGDVKDVVRELLSALSGTVDRTNQSESQFVDILVTRISRNISREIAGDTEMDMPNAIKLEGTDTMLPSDKQTDTNRGQGEDGMLIGGMTEYLVPRNVEVSISEALVDDLASTITKLQKITVGFHNARTFAYSGGSHKDFGEQIKKDGVKPADLVWTFKKEEDVNLAYNLFVQSLQQLKSQTARTITERYGSMSKVGGLTEAEYRAWIQLLALDDKYREAEENHKIAQDSKNKSHEELNKKTMDRIKQKKLRAIKMASGIAWGHSKEAWGVLLDAELLVKRGKDKDTDEYMIDQHYGGSQSSGIEKMVAELHPAIADNRWGRDKIAPIWMLYQPRDLEAADSKWKRSEPFSHTRLYDLYDQHQKAFYQGRSDDLADFDDEYITVHEFANVTSLHMLRRESWRLRQYELYADKYTHEASKDRNLEGTKLHDYVIKRLMIRGGPRLVKMYIDKHVEKMMEADKSVSGSLKKAVKNSEWAAGVEEKIGKEHDKLRKAQVKGREAIQYGKEKYYEKYIFDDISKRFATSLIALEQPRYMPTNERTLYTALNTYIEKLPMLVDLPPNVIQTEIYPIFIDAIHTVERNKWEKFYKSKEGSLDDQINRQLQEPKDLTDVDFDDPDIISKLKTHYKLNQERMGEITEKKHKLGASFEEYFASLKGFHRKLIEERDNDDRRNRNSRLKGKKETLAKRYAHMLAIDQGGVNQALGGSYFDFSMEIQQGGIDALNRLGGDVNKSAEMTEAWEKLTGDGGALEKFAQSGAEEEEDIKSGAKSIAEAIAGIVKYPYSFSPDQGNEYKVRHEIFWARAFSKPDAFTGFLGPLNEINWKNYKGGQSNLFAEYYQKVLGRTDVTNLDVDQVRAMLNTMEKELRIPPRKLEAAGYENVSQMGFPRKAIRRTEDALRHVPIVGPMLRASLRSITSPITEAHVTKYRTHAYNQDLALRELGARKIDVIRDKLFSIDFFAALFAGIGVYVKSANDELKKK